MKIRILKKIGRNEFVQTLLGRLLYFFVRLIYKTSHWTIVGARDEYISGDFSYLVTFWHGRGISDIFFKMRCNLQKRVFVLVSKHRDGRIMASAMEAIGVETIDGSSKRGGAAAALEIIKALKQPGNMIALSPDGREPGYKMTDGLVVLAKKSQRPIVLSAFSVKHGILLKTWDSYLVPFPFNKGIVVFSEPIYIPADLDADGVKKWRQILEDRLIELTREADRQIGFKGRDFLHTEGK